MEWNTDDADQADFHEVLINNGTQMTLIRPINAE